MHTHARAPHAAQRSEEHPLRHELHWLTSWCSPIIGRVLSSCAAAAVVGSRVGWGSSSSTNFRGLSLAPSIGTAHLLHETSEVQVGNGRRTADYRAQGAVSGW